MFVRSRSFRCEGGGYLLFGFVCSISASIATAASDIMSREFRSFTSSMRSNAWTTQPEYDFLSSQISRFLYQQEKCDIAPFIAETLNTFLTRFPSRATEFSKATLATVRNL